MVFRVTARLPPCVPAAPAAAMNAPLHPLVIEIVGDKGRAGADSSSMSLLVREELLDTVRNRA